jgi:hypothetical protein
MGRLSGRLEDGGKSNTVDTERIDLKLENVMNDIGYAAFVEMCQVDTPQNWHGMVVMEDGVWVKVPPHHALISAQERAVLSAHPMNDLTTPALKFPCTYKDLFTFLKWMGEGFVETYLGIEDLEVAKATKKGGRAKGPLNEAVEFAYNEFRNEGNTEILRPGKVIEFLDRLKDLAGGENRKISDYITERIEIVKKRNSSFTITTQERVIKEVKGRVTTEKKNTYTTADVSKLMTALRKKFPLPA